MNNVFLSFPLFVLPLGVDTFAVAAAAGTSRPIGSARWRISALFVLVEGGMPLVGLALGSSLGQELGSVAGYLSGGLLVLLGGYLWLAEDDDTAKAHRLTSARGLALAGLALSISLDELVVGFSLGLGAGGTAPAAIVAAIALQTLVVSQLGLSFGVRISERWREGVERVAGPMLLGLGGLLLAEALVDTGLLTARHAVAVGVLILIVGVMAGAHRFRPVWVQAASSAPPTAPSAGSQARQLVDDRHGS